MRYPHSNRCCSASPNRNIALQLIRAIQDGRPTNPIIWKAGRALLHRRLLQLGAGEESDDLATEAFLRLWRDANSLSTQGPSALIRMVCNNVYIDFLRHRRTCQPDEAAKGEALLIELQAPEAHDPGLRASRSEQKALLECHVARLLDQMSASHQQMIRRLIAGEKPPAIAESMDPLRFAELQSGLTSPNEADRRDAYQRLKAFRNRPNVLWSRFQEKLRKEMSQATKPEQPFGCAN